MPIFLADFCRRRPYIYHLTAASNVSTIRESGRLWSATTLAEKAGRPDLRTQRRADQVQLQYPACTLRDQGPLHVGNMALEEGWSLERFVALLNERVFFWPGTSSQPIPYGRRHFARYSSERPVMLRVLTRSILAANPDAAVEFCKFNSGSPRWSGGRPSPRGASTFRSAAEAPFRASEVVEVTFLNAVTLPPDTELGSAPHGPWTALW